MHVTRLDAVTHFWWCTSIYHDCTAYGMKDSLWALRSLKVSSEDNDDMHIYVPCLSEALGSLHGHI